MLVQDASLYTYPSAYLASIAACEERGGEGEVGVHLPRLWLATAVTLPTSTELRGRKREERRERGRGEVRKKMIRGESN